MNNMRILIIILQIIDQTIIPPIELWITSKGNQVDTNIR